MVTKVETIEEIGARLNPKRLLKIGNQQPSH
jgi:hypothetical protein